MKYPKEQIVETVQNRDNLGKLMQKTQINSRSRVLGLAFGHDEGK